MTRWWTALLSAGLPWVDLGKQQGINPSGLAEESTVQSHRPGILTVRRGTQTHDRLVDFERSGRSEESGIPLGEDLTVSGNLPVAPAIYGRCHAHNRLIEVDVSRRAVESS